MKFIIIIYTTNKLTIVEMEDIRGVRLRKFKLRKIVLGVRVHFRHITLRFVGVHYTNMMMMMMLMTTTTTMMMIMPVCFFAGDTVAGDAAATSATPGGRNDGDGPRLHGHVAAARRRTPRDDGGPGMA